MSQDSDCRKGIEPRLSTRLAELRERLRAGTCHGETFDVTVTNRELADAIAWYLQRQPGIPPDNLQVSIDPDAIEARVETQVGKMHLPISARVGVLVQNGIPLVTIEQFKLGNAGLPDFILFQVEDQLNRTLAIREGDLPVILEEVELEEGQLTVRGKIR